MKLKAGDVERFIKSPDPKVRAILIYGPDLGLSRERAETLCRNAGADIKDAFQVSDLSEKDLRDDPALLSDEAAAIPMMGGQRVVRVRDVGDNSAGVFSAFLEDPPPGGLVIAEAKELRPRAKIRVLFESSKIAVALPSYGDEGAGLERILEQSLREHGLSITPDARAFVVNALGNDRGVSRQEIEKLCLFKGPVGGAAGAQGAITIDDAVSSVGESAALSIDNLVDAILTGDISLVDLEFARLRLAGSGTVTLLRTVGQHLQRLHITLVRAEQSGSFAAASQQLRPKVYFKREASFRQQGRLWKRGRVEAAMATLLETEMQCKTTGAPEDAICARAFLGLATAARRAKIQSA